MVLLDSDNGTDKTFSFALLSFEGSAKVAMPECISTESPTRP